MWDEQIVTYLRNMIGDITEPFQYDDDRLISIILLSAQFVITDIAAFQDVYTIDLDNEAITPDPTEDEKDNFFTNLVLLKSACFIETGEARLAAAQAITIKDQGSEISLGGTGGVSDAKLKLWQQNFCKSYQEAKESYYYNTQGKGIAITGPNGSCGEGWSYYYNRYR